MKKIKLSKFDTEEMRWNCEMARLVLQNYWNENLPYSKRKKEAEQYSVFATLVFDEAVERTK